MKAFIVFVAFAAGLPAFAQVKFEPGYFINNDGTKTVCLIKNADWKNNPAAFDYKTNEASSTQTASIENVSEFNIDNFSKFKRYTVDIDQSEEDLRKISHSREPQFKKETVFLKVILEGNANLLFYETALFSRYFFCKDKLQPEQLIYKTYLLEITAIGENNSFRNQLWNSLKCETIQLRDMEKLNYNEYDLAKIISRYNDCSKTATVNYNKKVKKDLFNLNIRPGPNFSSLEITNPVFPSSDRSLGNQFNPRIGIEAEIIMPFQGNKWALIAEPGFQMFKYKEQEGTKTTTVAYTSMEVNAGFRHYFFLSNNSKIFLNATVIFDIPFNSYIQVAGGTKLDMKSSVNAALGAGYKFKSRLGAELRYQLNRELLNHYITWSATYKTFSLVFSYTLF